MINYLTVVPRDLWGHIIIDHLEPKHLPACAVTCKCWNEIVKIRVDALKRSSLLLRLSIWRETANLSGDEYNRWKQVISVVDLTREQIFQPATKLSKLNRIKALGKRLLSRKQEKGIGAGLDNLIHASLESGKQTDVLIIGLKERGLWINPKDIKNLQTDYFYCVDFPQFSQNLDKAVLRLSLKPYNTLVIKGSAFKDSFTTGQIAAFLQRLSNLDVKICFTNSNDSCPSPLQELADILKKFPKGIIGFEDFNLSSQDFSVIARIVEEGNILRCIVTQKHIGEEDLKKIYQALKNVDRPFSFGLQIQETPENIPLLLQLTELSKPNLTTVIQNY